jgi:hypothetical protein
MGVRDLKVGDPVPRIMDGIQLGMIVVAVTDHLIYCDDNEQTMYEEDVPLEEHWKFDRETGEEVDFDPAGCEGSRLVTSCKTPGATAMDRLGRV